MNVNVSKKEINKVLPILPKIIEQVIKINSKINNNQNISYVQYTI